MLWVDGALNPKIVAQPPETIAGMAGFDIPEGTKFFIVPETGAGPDLPFSGEKLTVTMALYRVAGHRRGDRDDQRDPGLSGPGPQLRHLFDHATPTS